MTQNKALLPDSTTAASSDTLSEVSPRVLARVLAISGLVMVGFVTQQVVLLALGVCASVVMGYLYPQALLMAAIAWVPFTESLSGGDQRAGIAVAYGVSDVLLLASLPGLLLSGRRSELRPSLGVLGLPVCLYLLAGLLSFCVNLSAMQGATLSYLSGFGRTIQIVLFLPLFYRNVRW
jgi:hypothetical protein